jgi:hypothetical protein
VTLLLWSADWQLRRTAYILMVVWTFTVSSRIRDDAFTKFSANRSKMPSPLHHLRHTDTCKLHISIDHTFGRKVGRNLYTGSSGISAAMENAEASHYLSQFIGKPLRIHVSDGRVFGGQMKCTDKVSTPSHHFYLVKCICSSATSS